MNFLMELIFEAFLEGVLGVTVGNPKLKTWERTIIWLLLTEGVAILLGIASVSMYRNGNTSGGIGCGIIATLLGIGFLIGGIYGHRRNWEQ